MSIPERLWRVAKGYWHTAEGRLADAEAKLAEAAAYDELAKALRDRPEPSATVAESAPANPVPHSSTTASTPNDPLAASYALLSLEPGASMLEVETRYRERLALLDPNRFPAGSPEQTAARSQCDALSAAYERLRDQLNPTETRFERLEF